MSQRERVLDIVCRVSIDKKIIDGIRIKGKSLIFFVRCKGRILQITDTRKLVVSSFRKHAKVGIERKRDYLEKVFEKPARVVIKIFQNGQEEKIIVTLTACGQEPINGMLEYDGVLLLAKTDSGFLLWQWPK